MLIAFAALTPTSNAPASPGPRTAATASSSSNDDARFDERLLDDVADQLDVRATRDLGDDAAVARVQIGLARDHRRTHEPTVVDDRGRGLVAGRLDPEHAHAAHDQPWRRSITVVPRMPRSIPASSRRYGGSLTSYAHMISASSPVSA